MYFYKRKGKQHLDLKGNLILSTNDDLIAIRTSSAGPRDAENAHYCLIRGATKRQKIRALWACVKFIWRA